jgi:hypothetical protein
LLVYPRYGTQYRYFANALKIDGKVMIDLQAFQEVHPKHRPQLEMDTRVRKALETPPDDVLDKSHGLVDSSLTDEQALVCPATAPGFAFQSKTWAKFTVRVLKPIGWQGGTWEELNMDEDRKQYIWKLTANHDWALDVRADRKDLGLKFLLHGRSGSGKSLTVGKFPSFPIQGIKITCYEESLADEMRKPLLAISEQNLTLWSENTAYAFDNSLQHAFKCACRWKALLFIDEADNFVVRNQGEASGGLFMGQFTVLLPDKKSRS